jgi:hypothetical protein
MNEYPIPERMKHLPISEKWGLPVPFFVAEVDGKPEFRMAAYEAKQICIKEERCWVCGDKLGTYRTFAIGPMCAINRLGADPPMHRECGEYSVHVCPFLINPEYDRRQKDRPPEELQIKPAGQMIARNPGVTLLWTTKKHGYHLEVDRSGVLFRLHGPPTDISWWARGRPATREEVMESIDSGYPILLKIAKDQDAEQPKLKCVEALEKARAIGLRLVPA